MKRMWSGLEPRFNRFIKAENLFRLLVSTMVEACGAPYGDRSCWR